MYNFRQGLLNSSFLLSSHIVVAVIQILSFSYVSRKLGPEQLGIYSTVGAFVAFFIVFAMGGLSRVALRETSKDLHNSAKIIESIIGLKTAFSLFSLVLCWFCLYFTAYDSQVKFFIFIFSLQIIINSFQGIYSIIFQANEKMKLIGLFSILYKLIITFLIILCLEFGYGVRELIVIQIFGNFCNLLFLRFQSRNYCKFRAFRQPELNSKIIYPGISFSLIAFLETISTRVDVLMLSLLSNSAEVGIYAVGSKIAYQGVIVRNLAGMAFFPSSTKYLADNKITFGFFYKYLLSVFLIFVAGLLFLQNYSEFMFVTIFGSEFAFSSKIFNILFIYLIAVWLIFPLELIFNSTGFERYVLYMRILGASINIPLNFLLYQFYGVIGIAYATSLTYFSMLILMGFFFPKVIKYHNSSV